MAAGNLIVATDFNQIVNEHKDVVWVAKDKEAFAASIEEALSGDHSNRIQKGLERVQSHS